MGQEAVHRARSTEDVTIWRRSISMRVSGSADAGERKQKKKQAKRKSIRSDSWVQKATPHFQTSTG